MENLSKEYVVSFAKPKGSAAMLDSIDPGYAYNWVDANGGGNCSAIQEGWDGNLSSEWRNVISSITYPYGGDSWLNGYMCWTGLNKSGSWDIFLKCPPYHKYELSGLIYNDNFESVAFCNVSPQ